MTVQQGIKYLDGQAFSERMGSAKTRKRVRAYLELVGTGYEVHVFRDWR